MSIIYLVTLHVDEKKLPTVLAALEGAAKLVSVLPTQEAVVEGPSRQHSYVDGKRNKGITGHALVLQTMAQEQRPYSLTELTKVFVAHRFAANSLSPVISRLILENKIHRVGDMYCLPGTTIKFGASVR
jgi:hypothetical protein